MLVLLYRRFVSPLVNMTSLLLAPLGGLMALALLGQPISISVYIGLLMLLGIVAKNSILLVDFAIEEMERGEDKPAAIIEAGHKRAQPIVMTTMAMVAGMVPTRAVAFGRCGLARADGHHGDRRADPLDPAHAADRAGRASALPTGSRSALGPLLRGRLLTYRPGDDRRHVPRPEAFPAE